jgi:hypothetical protein
MFRISNSVWAVGDAPVQIPTYVVGTFWETVLNEYNKMAGKTTGMIGVFTLDRKTNTVYAKLTTQETYFWNYPAH